MDWDDVRYFLALSRHGSVRAAGTSLGVSHSTVARRVEGLEQRLSVRLFDRTPEGYNLTDGGRHMIPTAERVEAEMDALQRELMGQDERLSGVVRVTCTDEHLSDFIVRDLARFCEKHPSIELELTHTYRAVDLGKREADIALRVQRVDKVPPEHLLGRRLVRVYYANYLAIEHAERLDPELVGNRTRWLGWGPRKADEEWVQKTSYPDLPIWGQFGTMSLQQQATRAGLGIAMLPCFMADRDLHLRRLSRDDLAPYFDIWMLSHQDLRDNARLRTARDYLARALLADKPLFHGDRPASASS